MRALLLLAAAGAALPPPTEPPFRHWRRGHGAAQACGGTVRNVKDYGASSAAGANATKNMVAINMALRALEPCDTLLIDDDYEVVGGIVGRNLTNATIALDGTLSFADPGADPSVWDNWPLHDDGGNRAEAPGGVVHYEDCFALYDSIDVSLTSSSRGRFEGRGQTWWDRMILGTLPPDGGDSRPKLVRIENCADVLVERIDLHNSPSWNLVVGAVRAEVRDVTVATDRNTLNDMRETVEEWLLDHAVELLPAKFLQPEDLNTDGIDPSGVDIWIHDVDVSNDDDSIAVKPSSRGSVGVDGTPYDCTQNILVENSKLVGFGASIGSVGPSTDRRCVDAVTMRNISMPGTGKGVYVKSNADDCTGGKTSQLSNLLFEDFRIEDPFWYAVWIGPQQQHEPHSSLGGKCALAYPLGGTHCPTQGCADFVNITLRNVTITNPLLSPGAILGNASNPMSGLVFENVVVSYDDAKHGGFVPWNRTYLSTSAPGSCINCSPVPEGFSQSTGDYEEARKYEAANDDDSVDVLQLSAVFGDSMVLQRGGDVALFGIATPGASVDIDIDGASTSATADAAGAWTATVSESDVPDAGAIFDVLVTSGSANATLYNVTVGDVYLCSGQSNMELGML